MVRSVARALVVLAAPCLWSCSLLFTPAGTVDAGSDEHDAKSDGGPHPKGDAGADAGVDAGPDAATCIPELDADGDGTCDDDDCDDADPLRHPGAPWPTFAIDFIDRADNYFDVVVDPDGNLRVAYASSDGGAVNLATLADGRWVTRVLTPAEGSARQVSLAVGPSGTLVWCFWDVNDPGDNVYGPLVVGIGAGVTRPGVEVADPGPTCDVAVDPQDVAHLAFYDPGTGWVMYSHTTGDEWEAPTEVGQARRQEDAAGYWSSVAIAIDGAGVPIVAYRDESVTDEVLVLATLQPGDLVLDYSNYAGRFPAMLPDGDRLRLCFRETESDLMGYGERNPDGTFVRVATFGNDTDGWCSLATHRTTPVVAWGDEPDDAEEGYVSRPGDDGWETSDLTPGDRDDRPRRPRVVVDRDGHLHVVFLDQATGELRHGVLHEDCPVSGAT